MSETIPETTETVEAIVKAPRRRGVYNTETMTVLVKEAGMDDATFDFNALPEAVKLHLGLHGMWMIQRAANTPAEGYEALLKGEIAAPKIASETVPELSPWKLAVAHALVEMTKKSPTPMTIEEAKEKASALDKKSLGQARLDPAVVKQHAKLFPPAEGVVSTLHSLVA